ncbi:glycosyltransferase [Halalkalibacterium halodurans]|uniref:CgeB family protein n=1 Tax=Halalkalibacterium halodurans TaxID=86665 RepID=UPI002E1AAF5F|nr:glycosyltransferase [Halalkalibacterium halodurans]MED4085234.1 glycosyltransferase [Halalkalibacterium halodurans]MED4104206.1 glycosyltransferase [Halalkalibacterium halodurans]MED4110476.1 glycosyltransferase [Halalkalibacterium halodurans]MED4148518.1 glycosyltransferase [Halalkalibacterium halodurans]
MLKLLYVPSGYSRVYSYLDQSIYEAFCANSQLEVQRFHRLPSLMKLQQMCQTFKPSFIFTLLGYKWTTPLWAWCKRKGLPVVTWFTEDPYMIDRSLEVLPYTVMPLTIDQNALNFYKQRGHSNAYYLPLGTNETVYRPLPSAKKVDVTLVGYPYPDRVEMIRSLALSTSYRIRVVGPWPELPDHVSVINRWVPPDKVASYYNSSKLVLNTYRRKDEKGNHNSQQIENVSVNNRTFEIASCNVLQISEYKQDLYNHFSKDSIVSFQSLDELIKQIDYYLLHDKKREKKAQKAYEEALTRHTFHQRVTTIINNLAHI